MPSLILSVYFGYHDSCVTLATRDEVLLHLEAERVFRKKNIRVSNQQMELLIAIGLDHVGADISDVDEVLLARWFSTYNLDTVVILGRKFFPEPTDHHANHIGTTIPSGFSDYICVVADGGSEDGTTKIYLRRENEPTQLLADHDGDIITGKYFGTLTQIVVDPSHDLAHQRYPGKLMGLAAHGTWSDELAGLISDNADAMNRLYMEGCDDLRRIFDISPDYSNYWLQPRRRDLAFTGQKVWIERFIEILKPYSSISRNIALAGGCAMNVVLCESLRRTGWFENVYVSPVSNDSGQSIGAILYKYPTARCQYPYIGRSFGSIKDCNPAKVASDLAAGNIVAWYQGPAEAGPRALGHRSLLGLPTSARMRHRISVEIKLREPFRPISPMVPAECLSDWFDTKFTSPFMGFSPPVRPTVMNLIPAVVHVDGTSRVQTIDTATNAELHEVLVELGRMGLPPVLMNTSFNSRGEPLVDSPDDARRSFAALKADILYINGVRQG